MIKLQYLHNYPKTQDILGRTYLIYLGCEIVVKYELYINHFPISNKLLHYFTIKISIFFVRYMCPTFDTSYARGNTSIYLPRQSTSTSTIR
jgi:hypothetical protein